MKTLSVLTEKAMTLQKKFASTALTTGHSQWSREQVMQGFVGDVGDLMKLVMAKNGSREIANTDKKLAHELADCLWSVLVLARMYDVDLENEFIVMVNEVSSKLDSTIAKIPSQKPVHETNATSLSSAPTPSNVAQP